LGEQVFVPIYDRRSTVVLPSFQPVNFVQRYNKKMEYANFGGRKWKILSKKIKNELKIDERPEYNFWKLTKVGCHADNGDKNIAKMNDEEEESFAGRLSRAEDEGDNGDKDVAKMHKERGAHECARRDAIGRRAAFSIRQDWTDIGENAEREGGKRGEIALRVRPADGAL